jgi:30S ribosomal protein S31
MGKGDRKTRRGKVYRGTYGKRRPRKKKPVTNPTK